MKKGLLILILIFTLFVFVGCSEVKEDTTTVHSTTSKTYDYDDDYDYNDTTKSVNEYQDDVNDWMKEQAKDKDYDNDDGGEYYCMGKGDTCNNKTRNAYDLYCNSCDPDGDNIEG